MAEQPATSDTGDRARAERARGERVRVRSRRRLGELLITEGVVTPEQLEEALSSGVVIGGRRERLGETVVRLGFGTGVDVARAVANQLDLEFIGGTTLPVVPEVARQIPAALAERHRVLPLWREADGTLVVACADPTNVVAIDDVMVAAGARQVTMMVASAEALQATIRRTYGDLSADELVGTMTPEDEPADDLASAQAELSIGDAPVVRLAHSIIDDAVRSRASDIHIEPGGRDTVVRYRIDGVLHQLATVPRSVSGPLISRLKLMSGMDIAERRRPQDGRFHFATKRSDQSVDLRVSSLASMHGETLVMRLLRQGDEQISVNDVGFSDLQRAHVLPHIERPQGLILITGPTGSGKTSTLYAFLRYLAAEETNLITVEDPIEYQLDGVNQTQVNDRIALTFARALRTVLRQDPDVVMVGEIRDPETAELALQASLTGHLVFSTLHTNDAPGATVRLRDLGIPAYLIASSLTMVLAQRLVRRVCDECAKPSPPTDRQLAALHLAPRDAERGTFMAGSGCDRCNHTGYYGRTGLFEILTVDQTMRDLLAQQASEAAIRHAARVGGMRSLREDGIDRSMSGLTTLEEVLRVTPSDYGDSGTCSICAEPVEDEFVVCPWCGANLRPDPCASCGRSLERGWRVCPTCATPAVAEQVDRPLPLILVVDDDPSVRGAIKAMLTGDYDVVEAEDGVGALDAIGRHRPDAVLLDKSLPDLDGYQVTRELRARPVSMNLPVIIITGQDEPGVESAGLRAGADDYLTKPLELEVLLARLEAVLRRAGALT